MECTALAGTYTKHQPVGTCLGGISTNIGYKPSILIPFRPISLFIAPIMAIYGSLARVATFFLSQCRFEKTINRKSQVLRGAASKE